MSPSATTACHHQILHLPWSLCDPMINWYRHRYAKFNYMWKKVCSVARYSIITAARKPTVYVIPTRALRLISSQLITFHLRNHTPYHHVNASLTATHFSPTQRRVYNIVVTMPMTDPWRVGEGQDDVLFPPRFIAYPFHWVLLTRCRGGCVIRLRGGGQMIPMEITQQVKGGKIGTIHR